MNAKSDNNIQHVVFSRRLVAIMCADIAGYSRLMGAKEESTHARVKDIFRSVVDPVVSEHRGRVVKTMGDGFLALFESPLEAVRCAIVIQQSITEREAKSPADQTVQFRIGINLGDVIVEADDVFGDGVNIAARLQTLASPGDVYISAGVYEQVKNKLVAGYESIGEGKLKNITDPVRIYRVLSDPAAVSDFQRSKWVKVIAAAALVAIMIGGATAGWFAWQKSRSEKIAEAPPNTRLKARKQAPAPAPSPAPTPSPSSTSPVPPPVATPRPETAQNPPSSTAPSSGTSSQPSSPTPPASAPPASTPSAPEPATKPAGTPDIAATPTVPVSQLKPGQSFRDCAGCPEMTIVPAGEFEMGSNDIVYAKPPHAVKIARAFAIGRREVSFEEWDQCVAAGACKYRPDDRGWGRGGNPVIDVSWRDAKTYTEWMSQKTGQKYRLPSEAEWEYAARAGSSTGFWWGRETGNAQANCTDCGAQPSQRRTSPTGAFQPNAFGLYDTAGNAAEWVEDCWNDSYRNAPRDGSAWTRGQCELRVLRGGSFTGNAASARSASRFRYDHDVRYYANGFRIVRELD
jgi:formylglycine-generating enzyme required for sulfatase activity/class 3 adenylate cyclase